MSSKSTIDITRQVATAKENARLWTSERRDAVLDHIKQRCPGLEFDRVWGCGEEWARFFSLGGKSDPQLIIVRADVPLAVVGGESVDEIKRDLEQRSVVVAATEDPDEPVFSIDLNVVTNMPPIWTWSYTDPGAFSQNDLWYETI